MRGSGRRHGSGRGGYGASGQGLELDREEHRLFRRDGELLRFEAFRLELELYRLASHDVEWAAATAEHHAIGAHGGLRGNAVEAKLHLPMQQGMRGFRSAR